MDAAAGRFKYSEEAIELTLGRSRLAAAGLAAMAVATLAVVAATPGSAGVRILLATSVILAALDAARALGLGEAGMRALLLRGSGEIDVRAASGGWRSGTVRAGSFVAPWLTIVVWRPSGSRFDRAVLVLPDMLAAEDFRRLRVLMRWA